MSTAITYSVSTNGGVVPGHEQEAVTTAFSSAFGIKQEKAAAYINAPKLIKKDLTQAQAKLYRDKLTQIGLPVSITKHGEEPVDEFDGLALMPTGNEPSNEESTPPSVSTNTNATAATAASGVANSDVANNENAAGFSCPKCQLAQAKTAQCTGCGVYIEKYLAAKTARGENRSSGDVRDEKSSASVAKRNEVDDDENENSFGYLPVALGLVVVSALIWFFISSKTGREFGLIAWALGGAIGYGAAFAGARGHVNGLVCAGLLVVAIAGGKYMLAGHFYNEFFDASGESSFQVAVQDEFTAMYDEMRVDALAYSKIDKTSGIAVKRFMIEHNYVDETSVAQISDEDAEDFLIYQGEDLEYYLVELGAASGDDEQFAGGADMFNEAMLSITRTDVFFSLWSFFDVLFLLIGASTAYKLASGIED